MALSSDLEAGTEYSFSFELTNGQFTFAGHDNVMLQADQLSAVVSSIPTLHSMEAASDLNSV